MREREGERETERQRDRARAVWVEGVWTGVGGEPRRFV